MIRVFLETARGLEALGMLITIQLRPFIAVHGCLAISLKPLYSVG